jgi:uncharacterized protein with FMN-binding domain
MKRALLIAGGTVGGLGAVLAITPPQLGANNAVSIATTPMGASSGTAEVAPASPTPSNTLITSSKSSTKASASSKPVASKTKSSSTNNAAATKAADPTPQATAQATTNSSKAVNGSFTGPEVFVNYGTVQVKITVVNGRITDAVAVQAPSGRNDRWTRMAVPVLKQQTLAAQSANIQGASGASYTSYGWYTSLQGALAQAGL